MIMNFINYVAYLFISNCINIIKSDKLCTEIFSCGVSNMKRKIDNNTRVEIFYIYNKQLYSNKIICTKRRNIWLKQVFVSSLNLLKIPSKDSNDFENGFREKIDGDGEEKTYQFVGLKALVSMISKPSIVYTEILTDKDNVLIKYEDFLIKDINNLITYSNVQTVHGKTSEETIIQNNTAFLMKSTCKYPGWHSNDGKCKGLDIFSEKFTLLRIWISEDPHVDKPANFCQNNGKCAGKLKSYVCSCQPQFTGTLCQFKSLCTPEFLKTCPEHKDSCEHVFPLSKSGRQRGQPTPLCIADKECQLNCHGGSCKQLDGKPKCHCPSSTLGEFCEINRCSLLKCKNGDCKSFGVKVKCVCYGGFFGQHCEHSMACKPNPCLNEGVCTDFAGSPICKCQTYYRGNVCEDKVSNTESKSKSSIMLIIGIISSIAGVMIWVYVMYSCLDREDQVNDEENVKNNKKKRKNKKRMNNENV